MALLCQFVDSIAVAPTVRLDLAADPWSVKRGTSLPPPDLTVQAADSGMQDGGPVTATHYTNRVLTLKLQLRTATQTAFAAAMRALHHELDRPTNFVRWQADGASAPVFFRTFRSPDYDIDDSLAKLAEDPQAFITLKLRAEPFAVTPRVDLGSVSTVHGSSFLATVAGSGIVGDVPAPGMVSWTPPAANGVASSLFLATRSGRALVHEPLVDLGPWTRVSGGIADTSVTPASSSYPLSPDNSYRRLTLAAGDTVILDGTAVQLRAGATDRTLLRGTYRALLVTRQENAPGGLWQVDLALQPNPTPYFRPSISAPPVLATRTVDFNGGLLMSGPIVDLGLVQMPFGADATARGYDAPLPVSDLPLRLSVTNRSGGSQSIGVDVLLLLPADESTLQLTAETVTGQSRRFTIDPFTGQVVTDLAGSIVPSQSVASYNGGVPLLTPGQDLNLVAFRTQALSSAPYTGITAPVGDTSFTLSYWPRYLGVGAP